jgi:fructose-1,6-bisphosphatase/inositol monophosphatase family enzyme
MSLLMRQTNRHYAFSLAVKSACRSKPKEGYRFDPVTDADREAERAIRAIIDARYPDHSIMGEEFGITGSGPLQWVLDPVDGTGRSCVVFRYGERSLA